MSEHLCKCEKPKELNTISLEPTLGVCCSCKKECEVYCLRKRVLKCKDCYCKQFGVTAMDYFLKSISSLSRPVNVLVCVSGGPSSTFIFYLLKSRIKTDTPKSTAKVTKIEAISTEDLEIENLHKIDDFSVKNVAEYAKKNGFNCIVLGDNAETIALTSLGAISRGRPDIFKYISTNDSENYDSVISRPVRGILKHETEFYCKAFGLIYVEKPSKLQRAFNLEQKMLHNIMKYGNESVAFTMQSLSERIEPLSNLPCRCPSCNLPSREANQMCDMCSYLKNY